jgi:hypothetical protein
MHIYIYLDIYMYIPSPNNAAVIDIAAIVPMQYDNKNENADFHVAIARAGAMLYL